MRYHLRKAEKGCTGSGTNAELTARYPRYGYRRIGIFLGRDGHQMSFGLALGALREIERRDIILSILATLETRQKIDALSAAYAGAAVSIKAVGQKQDAHNRNSTSHSRQGRESRAP